MSETKHTPGWLGITSEDGCRQVLWLRRLSEIIAQTYADDLRQRLAARTIRRATHITSLM